MIKRYRRKVVRRRRVYRRPRIYRNRKGMGYSGKRFFKFHHYDILQMAPYTATGKGFYITDQPNVLTDWLQLQGLFDSYRVCALKFRWIPSYISNELESSTWNNVPVYVYHDANSVISTTPSLSDVIQYQNLKIGSLCKRGKFYYKMRPNQPPSNDSAATAVSNRGYQSTSAPAATQTVVFFVPQFGPSDALTTVNIATLITTWYIVAKDAR